MAEKSREQQTWSRTSIGTNPCPVCWKTDDLRPMCFQSEPWCSDHCRKVILGEVAPSPKELTIMPTWLIERLGLNRVYSDANEMPMLSVDYDADEDSYYPSQAGPGSRDGR